MESICNLYSFQYNLKPRCWRIKYNEDGLKGYSPRFVLQWLYRAKTPPTDNDDSSDFIIQSGIKYHCHSLKIDYTEFKIWTKTIHEYTTTNSSQRETKPFSRSAMYFSSVNMLHKYHHILQQNLTFFIIQ